MGSLLRVFRGRRGGATGPIAEGPSVLAVVGVLPGEGILDDACRQDAGLLQALGRARPHRGHGESGVAVGGVRVGRAGTGADAQQREEDAARCDQEEGVAAGARKEREHPERCTEET
jgi:hypothetical protein